MCYINKWRSFWGSAYSLTHRQAMGTQHPFIDLWLASTCTLLRSVCTHHWDINTPISHNNKTPCLILCWSPLCHQSRFDPTRHGLHKTESCWSAAQWSLHRLVCPAQPTDVQPDWGLGSLENKSTTWILCHVPSTIPEQVFQGGRAHYPAERGHCL